MAARRPLQPPKAPTVAACQRLAKSAGIAFRIEAFGGDHEYWHVMAHPHDSWISIGHPKKTVALRMAHAVLKEMAEATR